MNKKLVALAVAGVFALPLAAQAQSTNVTLYGIVDMGVRVDRTQSAGTLFRLEDGIEAGTRIGLKGSEDLGGGLKANFTLETGVAPDTGGFTQGGLAWGRQSWVGLSGGFGEVRLGRQYATEFNQLAGVDPFGYGQVGHVANIYVANYIRKNNTVTYISPSAGGVVAEVQYTGNIGANEATTNPKDVGRNFGVRVNYAGGPVSVGGSFETTDVGPANRRHFALTGTFDLGMAKLAAAVMSAKCTHSGCGASTIDDRYWLLGATMPLGNGSLYASYGNRDVRGSSTADSAMFAIGYDYNMSKRTNLYASVGRMNNKSGAALGLSDASSGAPTNGLGYDPTAFAVGVRHKF
ncbi:Outer membrane porin protein 32 [Burkholderiales bacterium]|nr:MAG: porin [Burkholderiales bacterium]CAG0981950.1 Outer membrane porin protein 32 [Burkholderiales bacterium]